MAVLVKNKNPRKPYTVRYRLEGRQRERSFATSREATEFRIKFEHDSREQSFVDPRLGAERFRVASDRWLARHPGSPRTRTIYGSVLRSHVLPALGDRTLRQVASDREAVQVLLLVTMPAAKAGPSWVRSAYQAISGVVNDAVRSGRLASSRLGGIALPAVRAKAEFVFPAHAQLVTMVAEMPEPYRLTIWLMRGCGLRPGEALAVRGEGFGDGTLRLTDQMLTNGTYGPLKARTADEYRDVPVPAYVAARVAESGAEGRLFAPLDRRTYSKWFSKARDAAGIASDFTPHSLRHVFASVSLANGIPITDVSKWLGHRNINMTYTIYGHLVPSSFETARAVLDAEYQEWARDSQA